ncbi:Putative tick transposon, partial [Caligus rogercresseyi]
AINKTSNFLLMKDTNNLITFLVDTGAQVSVIASKDCKNYIKEKMQPIFGYGGNPIEVMGTKTLRIQIKDLGTFQWKFLVVSRGRPIMGADFLHFYKISVDLFNKKLYQNDPCVISDISTTQWVKSQCPEIFDCKRFTESHPAHGVEHHIATKGPPCFAKSRKLDGVKLNFVKNEIHGLLDKGILRPSSSNFSSAIHVVPKANGGWRMCGDYRQLNNMSDLDRYPLPNLRDFVANLKGNTIFSKMDLHRAYNQIPMNKDSINKTAIITPFGLYEYLRMPFGLKNAAQTFQRLIDSVLRGVNNVFVYLDDILIASKTKDEHRHTINEVLSRLKISGLFLSSEKCEFFKDSVEFLGHSVSKDGFKPLKSKIEALEKIKSPKSKEDLQRFLGMIQYYSQFIKNLSKWTVTLYPLLKKNIKFVWNTECEKAFLSIKKGLSSCALLSFRDNTLPLALTTDASDNGMGAVLEQNVNGHWQPLAFWSRALSETQKRYSTFDRELLGVKESIKHFIWALDGQEFNLFTDHKPLVSAISVRNPSWTPRQFRAFSFIAEFNCTIAHISGKLNHTADILSRNITNIKLCPSFLPDVIEDQRLHDPKLLNFKVKPNIKCVSGALLTGYGNGDSFRVAVSSPELRQRIIHSSHNDNHPGFKETLRRVSLFYAWPKLRSDVKKFTSECIACQKAKPFKTSKPTSSFDPPSSRLSLVHVDIIGPFPQIQGQRYALTIMDRHTRWPEVIPMPNITSITVARSFLEGWISRFGIPDILVSDRGTQFTSSLWMCVCKTLGITNKTTTSYHPESNGLIERFHRSLKTGLVARMLEEKENWMSALPIVLWGLRNSVPMDPGANNSPFQLLTGRPGSLASSFFDVAPPPKADVDLGGFFETMERLTHVPPRSSPEGTTQLDKRLNKANYVFLKNKPIRESLSPTFLGPFKVLEKYDRYFKVQLGSKVDNISKDRLRPAFGIEEILPETPNVHLT